MQPVPAQDPLPPDGWVYERQLVGRRCLAVVDEVEVALRIGGDDDPPFSIEPVLEALRAGAHRLVLDGALVEDDGLARYHLFDVLHVDGFDTTSLPLQTRKTVMGYCLNFADPLSFTTHRTGEAAALHDEACAQGWAGLVAKHVASRYVAGQSSDWRTLSCVAVRSPTAPST